jgi:uncharacterized membrane protein
MNPGGGANAWKIVSLSPLPGWALVLVLAAVLASVVLGLIGLRREAHLPRRAVLTGLRLCSALALGALLLEPGLRLVQTVRVKNRLLVLVDSSRSMAFPLGEEGGPEPKTRAQAAADWIARHHGDFEELERQFHLGYDGFDQELVPVDRERLAHGLAPLGPRTDLLGALQSAAREGGNSGGPKLAAVLVLSDGADNVGLAGGFGKKEELAVRALGVPVSTILVGKAGPRDLAVNGIKVDDFAFVRNTVTAEVTVTSQGFSGETIPVVLTRGGRVMATNNLTLRPGNQKYSVSFSFIPDQTGEFVYSVSVPVFPGEAVLDNNRRAFVLKVIRDRVRVLLVCGRPSWDERFLRGLLRQDPNVDLISFFILRGVHDNPRAGEEELSLIPFPTDEIFRTQLHTFDLVILQNFAFRPFTSGASGLHIESYFPDLRAYVQGGGSLLMVGGENSFGEGHYEETELDQVLPVSPLGLPPSVDLFNPRLTEEGRRHPVTTLAEGGEQSVHAWRSLPAIPGLNLVKAKPGARVLLEHPLLSVAGANAPVVVVADEGQGRSMALTTDSSWFWTFVAAGEGSSNRNYERFWNNAIRWLVRDPELSEVVKVAPERRTVEPGQPAIVVVKARRADYGPAAGATLSLQILDAETGQLISQAHGAAGNDGSGRIEIPDLPPGAYRVVARASSEGVELGQAEDALAVRSSGPETEDPLPHPEVLKKIADLSGGTYSELPRRFPALNPLPSEVVEVGRERDRPIWDRLWPLLLLCLTMGSEWWLRRRWGHL